MSSISTENQLSQSEYLYLQAVGSDGSDGTPTGIQLRWDLLGTLGDKHIPKGNLSTLAGDYYTTATYNRGNDYVKIYRTAYNRNYPLIVDLTAAPSEVSETQTEKIWKYTGIVPTGLSTGRTVILRFSNCALYNQVRSTYTPADNPVDFLKNYKGLIEVEVDSHLMFAAYVYMTVIDTTAANTTRIESISPSTNNSDNTDLFVSARKKYTADEGYLSKEDLDLLLQEDSSDFELDQLGNGTRKIIAENIQYIRFLGSNCYPTTLWLETYDDFVIGKNSDSAWEHVTDLALSLDDVEVANRLDNSLCKVDNLWPRYANGYTVDVDNYMARWQDTTDSDGNTTEEGLASAVKGYLTLSTSASNLEAYSTSQYTQTEDDYYTGSDEDETDTDQTAEEDAQISYLNALKLVAVDYHIARMLGFGCIDNDIDPSSKYIYMAVYDTYDQIDTQASTTLRHTFLTLPTSLTDYRLPYTPELAALRYGLYISTGDTTSKLISDADGYSKYAKTRAINLDLADSNIPYDLGYFFTPDEEYSFADYTQPIMYDLQYRAVSADNSNAWTELCTDSSYTGHNGKAEVSPTLGTDSNPLYTHLETNAGQHEYAVYGINWFSRVSAISNTVQTDDTEFSTYSTLEPPQNFAVQLIQTEKVLMLTTQAEQTKLAALTGDTTLVRVTFDWNDTNNLNYNYADKVQFYFRTSALNTVNGMVKSVTKTTDSNGHTVFTVRTTSYTKTTTDGTATVTPAIDSGLESHYAGSLLSTNGNHFSVTSVAQSDISGEGPIFTVYGLTQTNATDTDNDGVYTITDEITPPEAGYIFTVTENTSIADCWTSQLSKTVNLIKLSDHTETVTYEDGSEETAYIGGVYGTATIAAISQTITDNSVDHNVLTGAYTVTFDNPSLLPATNDADVEWYKGTVRIATAEGDIKVLNVVTIAQTAATSSAAATLVLTVVDPLFSLGDDYQPDSSFVSILTGTSINVNFHPGYRVYLYAQTGVFCESTLLPASGESKKYTYMACRSVDDRDSNAVVTSYLSTTALLLAREMLTPTAPAEPVGPTYATRPNFFGKATYTFNTLFGSTSRQPYLYIFYRASDELVLNMLYSADTVTAIRTALAAITDTTNSASRWSGLVNMDIDSDTLNFVAYDGYSLPYPDNTDYKLPDSSGQYTIYPFDGTKAPGSTDTVANSSKIFGTDITFRRAVQLAIWEAFIPITQQPVIYSYLKKLEDGNLPSAVKPVIRDTSGNLLLPTSSTYNQAPMAVRYTEQVNGTDHYGVRFTDFTLDGTSTAIYFYCVAEMTRSMEISDPSTILGPVKLVNTNPPKAPEIRKFNTQVESATDNTATAVVFNINPYVSTDEVSQIEIYRAFDTTAAQDIRTMTALGPYDIDTTNSNLISASDTFTDMSYIPYGDPIYYRLVAIRNVTDVTYDFTKDAYTETTESVRSYPSVILLANVIDVNNPDAPDLSIAAGTTTDTAYENVTISWTASVHNATYYLYQRNSTGTWSLLSTQKLSAAVASETFSYTIDSLDVANDDSEALYYGFKVSVVNSSGLVNLSDNISTFPNT